MIADSTALPEQLVRDALTSAFDSAGQRCSALRVLFLQSDIASKVLKLLGGAMAELKIGDPMKLETFNWTYLFRQNWLLFKYVFLYWCIKSAVDWDDAYHTNY